MDPQSTVNLLSAPPGPLSTLYPSALGGWSLWIDQWTVFPMWLLTEFGQWEALWELESERGEVGIFPHMLSHPFIEGLCFFRSPLYTIPSMGSCTTFMVGLKMVQGFLPFKPPRYCNHCLTAFLSPWSRVLSPWSRVLSWLVAPLLNSQITQISVLFGLLRGTG